jgi:hypothetical protein
MALDTELAELIRDSKNYEKANYVIAARLGGRDYIVGETTLGPDVDIPRMAASLARQVTKHLQAFDYADHEIYRAEPVLVMKFDALAELDAQLARDGSEPGDMVLVQEAMWIMLQAQKHVPTALNEVDREISYKGRSLRLSVAPE